MSEERDTQFQILLRWGAHPSIRLARCNVGVGWFANGQPARKTEPGAYPVRFNPPGTADIVGILAPSGRMIMIEVKSAKGKAREDQITMRRVVERFGGAYCIARSLEDADAFFASLGLTR